MATKIEFYMTAGIAADMDSDNAFACEIGYIIHRFLKNDWGELCSDDCELNREALTEGGRILGAYSTTRGRVYVITDDAQAANKVTTVLYASEY